jgi:hypothetical protein
VVSLKIVHNQYIAASELGQEFGFEPLNEPFRIYSFEHAAQEDPTGYANGAEKCQVGTPIHGNALDVFGALFHPDVTARHGLMESGFVEEHEFPSRNAANLSQEGSAFRYNVGP